MLAEDISEGGRQASCTDFVPRQARLLITFYRNQPEKEVTRIPGTVVWVRQVDREKRWRIGLAFDALPSGARAQVHELVTGRTL